VINIQANGSFHEIIAMARAIDGSGLVGRKGSKTEAQQTVDRLIGERDGAFSERYGQGYWNYLKRILTEYSLSRGLEDRCVVKAYPFHWSDTVNARCSAVILRTDYRRGEHYVEPELFLEIGVTRDALGMPTAGVTYGFHLLDGIDGDGSRFVKGVLEDTRLNEMVREIAGSGIVDLVQATAAPAPAAAYPGNGGNGLKWSMYSALSKTVPEEEISSEMVEQVYEALDRLLPFFLGAIALNR